MTPARQKPVNLLPGVLVRKRAVRRRIRKWIVIGSCWTILCGGAVASLSRGTFSGDTLASQVADLRKRIAAADTSIEARADDVDNAVAQLALLRAVKPSAPWEDMIGALGSRVAGEARVQRLVLREHARSRSVEIFGVADGPENISRVVLALEETGLFTGPLTMQSTPAPIGSGFTIKGETAGGSS